MNISISKFVSAILAFVLLPIAAYATPSEYNDHYYEVIAYATTGSPDKTWATAKAHAEAQVFMGVNGHLATITSSGEDAFIEGLRATALANLPSEAWVGGSTDSNCTPVPGCGWHWVNGEGAISTGQVPLSSYSNWLNGEPNNLGGGEQHLGIGLGGTTNVGWNDEGNLGNIGGYVIEYDVPIPVPPNAGGGDPIPLADGADVSLPATVVLDQGAQIDVRRFEYTDDLDACGTLPREIFLPGNTTGIADAVIPAYLCGSPKFLVIVAETTGVTFPSGTILVENQTDVVFPDNLYDCPGPINPDLGVPVTDTDHDPNDPQNRDVVGYQKDDRTEMPEDALGGTYGFAGSVAETTFECGSSRGKGNSASLYFVGLHIDFGPGAEFSVHADLNHDKFVALTRYKLIVLQDVILESEVALNSNWVQRVGFKALKRLVNVAIRKHDRHRYNAARFRLQLIDALIQVLPYTVIPGENYQGETEMRNSNGIFMYTEKVIPFAP